MGEDQSSLEKRLFRLMKQYEQPVNPSLNERLNKFNRKTPLLRSKKLKYSGHLPYTGEIMTNHGPTLSERVSNFWHEHSYTFKSAIFATVMAGVLASPLSCTLGLATYAVLDEINSPGAKADVDSSHMLFLKNSWLNPTQGVYISNADGSNYRLLVKEETRGEWRQTSLSLDEKRAAMVNYDWIGPDKVFVINTDGSRLSQLTFPSRLEDDRDPFWLDKDTIGFLRSGDKEQHLLIDVDENNIGYNLRPYDP